MRDTFRWTEERVKFFLDASDYTGFHRKLGEILRPYLKKDQTLCDLGCGLGLIDLQLAPYVKSLNAFDISEIAVADYKRRLAENPVDNLDVELSDAHDLKGRKWNIVLSSFYGGPDKDVENMVSLADDLVILITHLDGNHNKNSISNDRPTTNLYEDLIKRKGWDYEKIEVFMDFGQPFRNLSDAEKYTATYVLEEDEEKKAAIIKERMRNLEETGDETFPYFQPKDKKAGIFLIKAQ